MTRYAMSSSCSKSLGSRKGPEFYSPDRIAQLEVVPPEHIEVFASQWRQPGHIFGFHRDTLGA